MSDIFFRGAHSDYEILPAVPVSLSEGEPAMLSTIIIGKEGTNFVRACEAIHGLLAQGPLAPDDRDLIEFSGIELLSKLMPT